MSLDEQYRGRLVDILNALVQILHYMRDAYRLDIVGGLIAKLGSEHPEEQEDAINELTSNTFWGGSGSFIDTGVDCGEPDSETYREASSLSTEYKKLLLELLQTLRKEGHTHRWFDDREDWLSQMIEKYPMY